MIRERLRASYRSREVINVLGVKVDPTCMHEAVKSILAWARQPASAPRRVCASGVHGIMEAQADERLRRLLNECDLNVPDGMPVVWLGRFGGFDGTERVFGPDLMLEVCRASVRDGLSHYFYGGGDGVAEALSRRLEHDYPGLNIAGTFTPPYRALSAEEKNKLVQAINRATPDILWVGLSTPKQELWCGDFFPHLNAKVILAVGAAFDYNTGRIHRAPRWMQNAGLEWTYRLVQEPHRLLHRYIANNPRFLWCITGQLMGMRTYAITPGTGDA